MEKIPPHERWTLTVNRSLFELEKSAHWMTKLDTIPSLDKGHRSPSSVKLLLVSGDLMNIWSIRHWRRDRPTRSPPGAVLSAAWAQRTSAWKQWTRVWRLRASGNEEDKKKCDRSLSHIAWENHAFINRNRHLCFDSWSFFAEKKISWPFLFLFRLKLNKLLSKWPIICVINRLVRNVIRRSSLKYTIIIPIWVL